MNTKETVILVVGQTPPPYNGQALMIENVLKGRYQNIRLAHVRLGFSDTLADVGRFSFTKVGRLATTISAILRERGRSGATVLYYPPSGPNLVPILRDIALLLATRWAFEKTVFHFQAGGLGAFEHRLPAAIRPLFKRAYGAPELAIRLARTSPDDGAAIGAKRNAIIPNAVEAAPLLKKTTKQRLSFLFTGYLVESKGVLVALEAFVKVLDAGVDAEFVFMGGWGSDDFGATVDAFLKARELNDRVRFVGVKTGDEKFQYFADCDVFCFPSHYESESFPLVILEAMQFSKPVVSTLWRGIPEEVVDGSTGFLVPTQDSQAVAEKLLLLANDPELRERMGEAGRERFESQFTLEAFHQSMEREFLAVANASN